MKLHNRYIGFIANNPIYKLILWFLFIYFAVATIFALVYLHQRLMQIRVSGKFFENWTLGITYL